MWCPAYRKNTQYLLPIAFCLFSPLSLTQCAAGPPLLRSAFDSRACRLVCDACSTCARRPWACLFSKDRRPAAAHRCLCPKLPSLSRLYPYDTRYFKQTCAAERPNFEMISKKDSANSYTTTLLHHYTTTPPHYTTTLLYDTTVLLHRNATEHCLTRG